MWKLSLLEKTSNRCTGCSICDGFGCIDQLPGWGGINANANFIANCESWNDIKVSGIENYSIPEISLAPITGAIQNLGTKDEEAFYFDYLSSGKEANIFLSIGDGAPDYKLQFGIKALKDLSAKAAVFIKPYINKEFLKRIEWAIPVASHIGIDIDSWQIKTMDGQASMEKKSLQQLLEIKENIPQKIPFVVKGICSEETVALAIKLKPDAVVISNHGGRVQAKEIGTAYLLQKFYKTLNDNNIECWVDGGLRSKEHLLKASALGAKRVLIGRPFVQGALAIGKKGIKEILNNNFS